MFRDRIALEEEKANQVLIAVRQELQRQAQEPPGCRKMLMRTGSQFYPIRVTKLMSYWTTLCTMIPAAIRLLACNAGNLALTSTVDLRCFRTNGCSRQFNRNPIAIVANPAFSTLMSLKIASAKYSLSGKRPKTCQKLLVAAVTKSP